MLALEQAAIACNSGGSAAPIAPRMRLKLSVRRPDDMDDESVLPRSKLPANDQRRQTRKYSLDSPSVLSHYATASFKQDGLDECKNKCGNFNRDFSTSTMVSADRSSYRERRQQIRRRAETVQKMLDDTVFIEGSNIFLAADFSRASIC